MLELYKNIKTKRQELKMTQDQLAQKCGYTNRSTIATIEAGKVDLPLSKIHEFAKALNCTASDLMGWSVEDLEWRPDLEKSKKDATRQKKIDQFTPSEVKLVDDLIDTLYQNHSK